MKKTYLVTVEVDDKMAESKSFNWPSEVGIEGSIYDGCWLVHNEKVTVVAVEEENK